MKAMNKCPRPEPTVTAQGRAFLPM